MIATANANPANANLVALSSTSYQDYVVQNVPDAGTTLVLLGLGLVAMAVVGRKARSAVDHQLIARTHFSPGLDAIGIRPGFLFSDAGVVQGSGFGASDSKQAS